RVEEECSPAVRQFSTPPGRLKTALLLRPEDLMKRLGLFLAILMIAFSATAADSVKQCSLCVGAVSDLSAPPAAAIPLLFETTVDDLATVAQRVDALSPEQRKNTAIVVRYSLEEGKDPLI